MSITIRKAERKQAKLRVGISGPSGSGKTYSALLLARGLASDWDKILVIDSENGSAELYSDLGPYNVISLTAPFSPEKYIEAIKAGEEAGMEIIIIDSTSHEWEGSGGCLEINELLAKTKFRGNTWSAWSETTPRHQKFIAAIVTSTCHIVTTARSKTDTIQTKEGDRTTVKKVGMKEIQRDGFEYELTVNFNLDRDGHLAVASKDRTGLFISRDPFTINQKIGQELLAWNGAGKADPAAQKRAVIGHFRRLEIELPPAEDLQTFLRMAIPALTGLAWSAENLEAIVGKLAGITDKDHAYASLRPQPHTVPPPTDPEPEAEPLPEPVPETELRPEDVPF